ncbi:uncharacterized protein SPPG_04261 [Spizellomyces punctatus DAOM BR117]|uniref:Exosome complex protein n=1 Tax=Spizellomyces punctatus (strain DAOM BR117) TaxID=645134 RepID=A0A0L0HIA8_SPIPD|nr:uncharacterized protein SPPG_04261 [Spizellomyces punctatus DAOM BR117]KND01171.1 hypothetical protein SPPG_04261 [Spizellomyces punctatus DAOM BR117]|eukprot:XP_016609210.1 hypothetical protein SPPG_04261 [Spizellomyces punctatus DAOM BR117]
MDEEVVPDLSALTDTLESAVSRVTNLMEPLFSLPFEQQLGNLAPLERAKLEVLMAFAMNSLIFVYLKTQGVQPDAPVKREMLRIKGYINKIKDAAGLNKPTMRLDSQAAKRFVNHSLIANPEVSEEIKKRKHESEADNFLSNISLPTNGASTPGTASGSSNANTSEPDGDVGKEEPAKKKKKKNKKKKDE